MHPTRDHIFISYATEDFELARWLTAQLTTCGYRVWCDQVTLLGGESFPTEIDKAISERTFRLIALMSAASLDKPNPKKERTLALALARERNEEFLIPLNVDGLAPSQLGWMMSDITFIPFADSWATGLSGLLKKLERIDAPQPLSNGPRVAASAYLYEDVVKLEPDKIITNCFEFADVPETLFVFRPSRQASWESVHRWSEKWPCYYLSERQVVAFGPPVEPPEAGLQLRKQSGVLWKEAHFVSGVRTSDILTYLLRKSLYLRCLKIGMVWDSRGEGVAFPSGILEENTIRYIGSTGRKTRVKVRGDRTSKRLNKDPLEWRYSIGIAFFVRRHFEAPFTAIMRVRTFILDRQDRPLDDRIAQSKRKSLTRYWYNRRWHDLQLAFISEISRHSAELKVAVGKDVTVCLRTSPIVGEVPLSIDEEALDLAGEDDARQLSVDVSESNLAEAGDDGEKGDVGDYE